MTSEKAFCCAPLKIGNLIIGWFHMVRFVLQIVAIYVLLNFSTRTQEIHYPDMSHFTKKQLLYFVIIAVANLVLDSSAVISLLYGTYQKRPLFFIPYLVIFGLYIVVYSFTCILILLAKAVIFINGLPPNTDYLDYFVPHQEGAGPLFGVSVIIAGIMLHSVWVVGSSYRHLRFRKKYSLSEGLIS